jgi:hypothetical protein
MGYLESALERMNETNYMGLEVAAFVDCVNRYHEALDCRSEKLRGHDAARYPYIRLE